MFRQLKEIFAIFTFKNIIITGVLVRLSIFSALCIYAFPYGPSPPISPFHFQTGMDLGFYIIEFSYSSLLHFIENLFIQYRNLLFSTGMDVRFPGPVYPFLIWITEYSENNTLTLSIIIFLLEMFTFIIWCNVFKNHVYGLGGLLFCLMPQLIWYGVLISSDVVMCFFVALALLVRKRLEEEHALLIIICLLAALSKPSGLLFLIFFCALPSDQVSRPKYLSILSYITALIILIYYLPYFLVEQEILSKPKDDYSDDEILFRFFYIFGFHPSESGLWWASLIRWFFGSIFLVGFFHLVTSKNENRAVVLCFVILVVLFFHPSWRYLLPIIPIFYFEGLSYIRKKTDAFLFKTGKSININS